VCKSIRYSALVIAFIALIAAYLGTKHDNRSASFLGCLIAVFSLSSIAPSAVISKEIGETVDSIEVFREDSEIAYSKGYQQGSEDVESKISLEFADKTSKLESEYQETITGLKSMIESQNVQIKQLKTAILKLKPLASKVSEVNDREAELKEIELQLRRENDDLNEIKMNLTADKVRFEYISDQLFSKDETIRDLQAKLENLVIEQQDKIDEIFSTAYTQGYREAENLFSLEKQKLSLQIQQLELKLNANINQTELEKSIPTLEKLIKAENKPFMVTASQRAGKALTAAYIAQLYAGNGDLLPYVLDVSEGGSLDSTWHKLGIPNTSDPIEFLAFMIRLKNELDPEKSTLPFRNNREAYSKAPTIVVLIDELLTCLQGLNPGDKQDFVECLRAFETRGNKRKVYVGVMSQDDQIQNLSKLINSGNLRNYYRIYLNDGVWARATKENLDKSGLLSRYLDRYKGHYVSAIESHSMEGHFLQPFKHVSHHGLKISETTPHTIPKIKLGVPYKFFGSNTFRNFEKYLKPGHNTVTTPSPQVTTKSPQSPESFNSDDSSEYHPKLKIPYSTIDAVLDCRSRGLNQAQTILEVWGVPKKGNSKKWTDLRDLYNQIIAEF
jgi:flagellar biosynthesis/type III secretory pathway protein FliH